MPLHLRPATLADLSRLHALCQQCGRGLYPAALLQDMPRLWAELLAQRRLELHVFEDLQRPPAEQIQGMASGGFVREDFAHGLLANFVPGVAERVMQAEREGEPLLLTVPQAARANALGGGLCALGLDFAFQPSQWGPVAMLRWAPLLVQSLERWVDGWRLQMGLRELIGRDLFLTTRAMGTPVHARRLHAADGHRLPADQRRYLVGMTRAQADRLPAALASLLFFHRREPMLGLSAAEQELLLLALHNVSDVDCALQLGISSHTVKMRWRQVFDRVADRRPELLGLAAIRPNEGQRGPEKRRHLLAYLRQHMEELRPWAPDDI